MTTKPTGPGAPPTTKKPRKRRARKFAVSSVVDPLTDDDGQEVDDVGAPIQEPEGEHLEPVAASRAIPNDSAPVWEGLVSNGDVIPPPYDPWALVCTVEESATLPYLIDTIATNVAGFGVQLVPTFQVRDEGGAPIAPPADAADQKAQIERFLVACSVPLGLEGVIDRTDRDTETIGWGSLEVLRTPLGEIAALEHIRSYSMRLGRLSGPVRVNLPIVHPSTGEIVVLPRLKRFRTYVQLVDGRAIYFRELGDPRPMDRCTGRSFPIGSKKVPKSRQATEIVWVSIYSPHTAYGVPRWIGGASHARAEREATDLVVSWFMDAPIGAKLAMIAGGVWNPGSLKSAIGRIDAMARGRENAWSLIALEADKMDASAYSQETGATPARIGLEDLAYELPPGLYQGEGNLIDESARRLARLFRLPPVYWGGSDDFSRAAVNGARAAAEEQVIRPIRRLRWENRLNHEILPMMGINRYRIRLAGASTTDDTEIANTIGDFVQGGGVAPNALIRFWNDLTAQDVPPITEPWGDRPLGVTLELIKAKADPNIPLADLAGKWDAEAEQAKADAAAQLQAMQDAGGPGPGGDAGGKGGAPFGGKKPAAKGGTLTVEQARAIKGVSELVADLGQVRDALAKAAQADPSWMG